MKLWEIFLVCIGLSLDVFAVAVWEGAQLARVKPVRLTIMALIFCGLQVVALELGWMLSTFPMADIVSEVIIRAWQVVTVVIFLALAAYLIYKAVRRQTITEHLSEIRYKHVLTAGAFTSIDALFAGVGSGFLQAHWLDSGIVLLSITALCVVAGVFTGYHFGYEQKKKAYWLGGACFIAAAADVVIRYL